MIISKSVVEREYDPIRLQHLLPQKSTSPPAIPVSLKRFYLLLKHVLVLELALPAFARSEGILPPLVLDSLLLTRSG